MNANMTWKIGDVIYTTETPTRTRIDYYVFESTSTITVDTSVSQDFTCTVSFNAPTDIVYDFIATNAPVFSASCSVAGEFLYRNVYAPILYLFYNSYHEI